MYLCKLHMVAGVMPFSTLKKTDVFYTLSGKSAETDSSAGVCWFQLITAMTHKITNHSSILLSILLCVFHLQDSQTKIRLHGSRKKSVILKSDLLASNGMIHIVSKLMDSVPATVESNTQVYAQQI